MNEQLQTQLQLFLSEPTQTSLDNLEVEAIRATKQALQAIGQFNREEGEDEKLDRILAHFLLNTDLLKLRFGHPSSSYNNILMPALEKAIDFSSKDVLTNRPDSIEFAYKRRYLSILMHMIGYQEAISLDRLSQPTIIYIKQTLHTLAELESQLTQFTNQSMKRCIITKLITKIRQKTNIYFEYMLDQTQDGTTSADFYKDFETFKKEFARMMEVSNDFFTNIELLQQETQQMIDSAQRELASTPKKDLIIKNMQHIDSLTSDYTTSMLAIAGDRDFQEKYQQATSQFIASTNKLIDESKQIASPHRRWASQFSESAKRLIFNICKGILMLASQLMLLSPRTQLRNTQGLVSFFKPRSTKSAQLLAKSKFQDSSAKLLKVC